MTKKTPATKPAVHPKLKKYAADIVERREALEDRGELLADLQAFARALVNYVEMAYGIRQPGEEPELDAVFKRLQARASDVKWMANSAMNLHTKYVAQFDREAADGSIGVTSNGEKVN